MVTFCVTFFSGCRLNCVESLRNCVDIGGGGGIECIFWLPIFRASCEPWNAYIILRFLFTVILDTRMIFFVLVELRC